jgi:hypothetical protein
MMKRTSVLFGLAIALGMGVLAASPVHASEHGVRLVAKKDKKATKSEKSSEPDDAVPADTGDIDQKLADARDERDRSLEAAAQEKDPAKVEQKKREVFAKYAAICAALRDAAAKGDATASPAPDPVPVKSKSVGKTKSEPAKAEPKAAKPAADSLDTLRSKLASINDKLADLASQHDSKLGSLQQKLDDAKDGGKAKAIEKAESAVDKENSAYASKKSDLDSQKSDLQKQIDVLSPPAPLPASKK